MIRSLVYNVVRLYVVAVMLMAGLNKLTDKINPDMHNTLASYAPGWEQIWSPFGIPFTGAQLLNIIGGSEVLGALGLFLPGLKSLANLGLLIIMAGAYYTHYVMGDVLPTMVLSLIGALFSLFVLRPGKKVAEKNKKSQ